MKILHTGLLERRSQPKLIIHRGKDIKTNCNETLPHVLELFTCLMVSGNCTSCPLICKESSFMPCNKNIK